MKKYLMNDQGRPQPILTVRALKLSLPEKLKVYSKKVNSECKWKNPRKRFAR